MLKVVAIRVVMQAQVTLMHTVITGQSIMIGVTIFVGVLTGVTNANIGIILLTIDVIFVGHGIIMWLIAIRKRTRRGKHHHQTTKGSNMTNESWYFSLCLNYELIVFHIFL